MGLRKDLLDRIPVKPEGIDTRDWIDGRFFTVSLRGSPLSPESGAHGVVLLIDRPTPDVLYQFSDLTALKPQYGQQSIQFCEGMLARAIRLINMGIYDSPVPSVVLYSAIKPFRYPSREFALDRLYRRHVNFMLPANEKTGEEGGTLMLATSNRINDVLAVVQMQFSQALMNAERSTQGGVAMIGLNGDTLGLVEVNQDDAVEQITQAGARLILMPQRNDTATLVAISEQAAELSHQLAEQIGMLRLAMGVDVQIGSSDQMVDRVGDWLREANN